MSEIQFQQPIPILRIFDIAKAKEFYVGFLGFQIDWEHRFDAKAPLYMQVSRGGLLLHLSERYGDSSPSSTCFVWMTGIKSFHEELIAKDHLYLHPGISVAPWNAWCMEVIDPFGSRLRFSERLPEAA